VLGCGEEDEDGCGEEDEDEDDGEDEEEEDICIYMRWVLRKCSPVDTVCLSLCCRMRPKKQDGRICLDCNVHLRRVVLDTEVDVCPTCEAEFELEKADIMLELAKCSVIKWCRMCLSEGAPGLNVCSCCGVNLQLNPAVQAAAKAAVMRIKDAAVDQEARDTSALASNVQVRGPRQLTDPDLKLEIQGFLVEMRSVRAKRRRHEFMYM
jgi:hypothetical protein